MLLGALRYTYMLQFSLYVEFIEMINNINIQLSHSVPQLCLCT
jgi:hypothetical protein